MKLWEVLKALDENPKKRFKSNGGYGEVTLEYRGGVKFIGIQNTLYGAFISESRDWHEVIQPVTWQEAFEAWLNGKTVFCFLENGKRVEYDQNINFIHAHSLKTGTWYIED